jgi:hypothetical protein
VCDLHFTQNEELGRELRISKFEFRNSHLTFGLTNHSISFN